MDERAQQFEMRWAIFFLMPENVCGGISLARRSGVAYLGGDQIMQCLLAFMLGNISATTFWLIVAFYPF